jgi:glycosyltransferase involved in cell wall biosynthesis
MEAMAASVAVVATDIPGCSDLVADGHTGFLFELDNADALVDRLNKLTNPEMRDTVARQGRAFVVANYSATSMAAQYERLYQSLVRGRRVPA